MKIYLAGGHFWEGKHNWRNELVNGLRQYREPDYEKDEDVPDNWPIMENSIYECLDYVGPYPDVRTNLAKEAIQQADFIFAWIDELLPPEVGRVSAELGYASALGKPVAVGSTDSENPSFLNIWVAVDMAAFYPDGFIYDNPKAAFVKAFDSIFTFLPSRIQAEFGCHPRRSSILSSVRVKRSGYVYIIKAETGEYKIGRTRNVPNRMKLFAVKLPFDFEIIHFFPCLDVYDAESFLHHFYTSQRKRGEWFTLTDEDVETLKSIECFVDFDFVDRNESGIFAGHPRFTEIWNSF